MFKRVRVITSLVLLVAQVVACTTIPAPIASAIANFNTVTFFVTTGSGGISSGEAANITLRFAGTPATQSFALKPASGPAWKSHTSHTVTVALPAAIVPCGITGASLSYTPANNAGASQTWSVTNFQASLSISGGDHVNIIQAQGAPLTTLSAAQRTYGLPVNCPAYTPLFNRIGGAAAIAAAVNTFATALVNDAGTSARVRTQLNNVGQRATFEARWDQELCYLAGGPCGAAATSAADVVFDTGSQAKAAIQHLADAVSTLQGTASDKNSLLGAPLLSGTTGLVRPRTGGSSIQPDVSGVIATPQYVNLFWNSGWDAAEPQLPAEALNSYEQAVLGSTYYSALSQYGVTGQQFLGGFLPNSSCTSAAPASVGFYDPVNASIIGFLQCELDNEAALPQDDNIIYNIVLPPTSTEQDSIFQTLCAPGGGPTAWHFHGTPYSLGATLGGALGFLVGAYYGGYFGAAAGALIGLLVAMATQGGPFYTITSTSSKCNDNSTPLNTFSHALFHEMIEAATDSAPSVGVIFSPDNEIVDICDDMNVTPSAPFVPRPQPSGNFVFSAAPAYFLVSSQTCSPGFSSTTVPGPLGVALSGVFPNESLMITSSAGLGTLPFPLGLPTSATLPYYGIIDTTNGFSAGNSLNNNLNSALVSSWTDSAISVGPFQLAAGSSTPQVSDSLTVWACNPASGACAEASATVPPTSGPTLPPARFFQSISFSITTGGDDARGDSEVWASINDSTFPQSSPLTLCLKPSSSVTDSVCKTNVDQDGRQEWGDFSTTTPPLNFSLSPPQLGLGTVFIKLISHISTTLGIPNEDPDNWNIQALTITATDQNGVTSTLFSKGNPGDTNGNDCFARLKAPPNATTVRLALDGSNGTTYVDGTSSEQNVASACLNNGG